MAYVYEAKLPLFLCCFIVLYVFCFICFLHVLLVDLNGEVFHGYVVLWVERADEVEGTWREHTKQKRVTLVPEMKSE